MPFRGEVSGLLAARGFYELQSVLSGEGKFQAGSAVKAGGSVEPIKGMGEVEEAFSNMLKFLFACSL